MHGLWQVKMLYIFFYNALRSFYRAIYQYHVTSSHLDNLSFRGSSSYQDIITAIKFDQSKHMRLHGGGGDVYGEISSPLPEMTW